MCLGAIAGLQGVKIHQYRQSAAAREKQTSYLKFKETKHLLV